jgi:tRNA dimethylallyltransferase
VVVGPTAVGKSDYAVGRALAEGGEIVSADSMQVYIGLDKGTSKPVAEERRGVPHHMIDVADPGDRYSVADYQKMAASCLDDIASRNKRAIIAGGTGLYISSLMNNVRYPVFDVDESYRARLAGEAGAHGSKALHETLARIDPESAMRIHENDLKRIIRALEVFRATGETIGEHERRSRAEPPKYAFRIVGLGVERGELYRRIDERVDNMIAMGLEDEARMIDRLYGRRGASAQAIGYKELYAYFDGECAFEDAVEKIKTETRRYAKRQLTWFRSVPGIIWTDPLDISGQML